MESILIGLIALQALALIAGFLQSRALGRVVKRLKRGCEEVEKNDVLRWDEFSRLKVQVEDKERAVDLAIQALRKRQDELTKAQKRFDELAADALESQAKADKFWSAGVEEILSFGKDLPGLTINRPESGG